MPRKNHAKTEALTHGKTGGNNADNKEGEMLIEKGIPISRTNPTKYPWESMEVGDSFYVKISADSLRGSANNHSKRTGKKFVVRTEGKGARAWRVE